MNAFIYNEDHPKQVLLCPFMPCWMAGPRTPSQHSFNFCQAAISHDQLRALGGLCHSLETTQVCYIWTNAILIRLEILHLPSHMSHWRIPEIGCECETKDEYRWHVIHTILASYEGSDVARGVWLLGSLSIHLFASDAQMPKPRVECQTEHSLAFYLVHRSIQHRILNRQSTTPHP